MIAMSEKKARQLGLTHKKPAKYNNQKKVIDGIKFDSIKESEYYCQLKILQKAGEVIKIELQPRFELIKPKTLKNGKRLKGLYYVADFRVTYSDGRIEIVDVKGMRTQAYINKIKVLYDKYPDINFKEVH